MNKQPKITNKMQEVAVDILEELEALMMVKPANELPKELFEIFDKMFKKYDLQRDPFTQMVCTTKEWAKNSLEYNRQLMMARYGHCDGLD